MLGPMTYSGLPPVCKSDSDPEMCVRCTVIATGVFLFLWFTLEGVVVVKLLSVIVMAPADRPRRKSRLFSLKVAKVRTHV